MGTSQLWNGEFLFGLGEPRMDSIGLELVGASSNSRVRREGGGGILIIIVIVIPQPRGDLPGGNQGFVLGRLGNGDTVGYPPACLQHACGGAGRVPRVALRLTLGCRDACLQHAKLSAIRVEFALVGAGDVGKLGKIPRFRVFA